MLCVALPIHVEGELNEGTKALFALPQLVHRPPTLRDVARQAQKSTSTLLKLANANLHREGGPVLTTMASLESDRFAGEDALLQALDRRIVETDIEIASMFADQFFPAVAQIIAGLAVDVENGGTIVKQKEGVSCVIHERAEAGLALSQLRDVLQNAELAQRPPRVRPR